MSERAALAFASRVIVTSSTTERTLAAKYSVETDRIHIARPGNDACGMAPGSRDGVTRLLSVGAVTPRKHGAPKDEGMVPLAEFVARIRREAEIPF